MIANKDLRDSDYVILDAAWALKNIGFDVPTHTHYFWHEREGTHYINLTSNPEFWQGSDSMINRPILQKAVEWLRDKRNVSLRINYSMAQKKWFFDYLDMEDGSYDDSTSTYEEDFGYFDTYNEAVNQGIIAICIHIQNR